MRQETMRPAVGRSFTPPPKFLKLVIYQLLLLMATVIGLAYGLYFSDLFFPTTRFSIWADILTVLKYVWLVPLPYALLNFYSFVRYPVFLRPAPSHEPMHLPCKIYVRIVTRGLNLTLIGETASNAEAALRAVLPLDQWHVEIVTDNPVSTDYESTQLSVIAVPVSYEPSGGAKYKARALHYALSHTSATWEDWVVHLDEETHFTEDTVRAICRFILQQRADVAAGKQRFPRIGQGVILYGRRKIVNWITTLADSIRVGDDYGRFRLQYEHGKAGFGIHGSFIVINQGVETRVGFDHGPAASITEDAYFALMAQHLGVEFGFIHAYMDEKSPFTLFDFVRQRRRWFGGLWLCALERKLPLSERLPLLTFMVLWSVSWLCILLVYINLLYPTGTPVWLAIVGGVSFAYYVTLYIIGFMQTFPRGTPKFWRLLAIQIILIPVFSLMEAAGVFYGLIKPPGDFYIVKKEA